jgi:hypothetical protein
MLKDHEIKDKMLKALAGIEPNHYITIESIASYLEISQERAKKLLEEIYADSYCKRITGYGNHAFQYFGNADTKPFLQKGGYTKIARNEYLKNFPKDKWYLLDPVKFIGGVIVGSLLTLLIQRLTQPKPDLPNNTQQEQKNINTGGKDSVSAPRLDTSKHP